MTVSISGPHAFLSVDVVVVIVVVVVVVVPVAVINDVFFYGIRCRFSSSRIYILKYVFDNGCCVTSHGLLHGNSGQTPIHTGGPGDIVISHRQLQLFYLVPIWGNE